MMQRVGMVVDVRQLAAGDVSRDLVSLPAGPLRRESPLSRGIRK
jgi:hypothetical protein